MTDKRKRMISHEGYVVVCDGHKALIIRNEGFELNPDLQVRLALEAEPNPPTHEQGTDRPPRVRLGDRRSAIEQTDWHAMAERRFAEEVAIALEALDSVQALVVVAPAHTLAALRFALSERLRRAVIAEVDKDLTKHTVGEIQRHLWEAS